MAVWDAWRVLSTLPAEPPVHHGLDQMRLFVHGRHKFEIRSSDMLSYRVTGLYTTFSVLICQSYYSYYADVLFCSYVPDTCGVTYMSMLIYFLTSACDSTVP